MPSSDGLGLDPALERKLRRQLEEWRSSLVAVDGRQRLVYFKHMRTASLELAAPEADEIVDAVMAGSCILTAPPPEDSDEPDGGGRLPAQLLRRPAIEVGNKTTKDLGSSLRRLDQVSQQTFADRGFWSLYVGAGFLKWRDHDDKPVESPLLLVPVRLRREGDAGSWSVEATEDDVDVNPALQLVMEQNFGITLPEPDADEVDLAAYLEAVRRAVAKQPRWSVVDRAVLTTFAFHKEAIYRDLSEHAQQVLEHPMVQLLALGPDSPTGEQFAFDDSAIDDVDAVLPPEQMMSILDADSSQRRCIIAAREGHSFVMDGPPGTGKSQTIANIIVELIASGRSVLFVSEKAAALDVVRNRLADKRLSPFLLELHSHAATRKQVAAELHSALTQAPRARSRFGSVETRTLVEDRRQLSEYAEAMNSTRPRLGRSLFTVLGRIARLEQHRHVAVPTSDSWADLDAVALATILDHAARLGRSWRPVLLGSDFLWRDIRTAGEDSPDADSMERAARRARDAAQELVALCDAIDEDFGWPFGRTLADAVRRREVLSLTESRPQGVLVEWLSRDELAIAQLAERTAQLRAVTQDHHSLEGWLLREAGPRHGELDSDRANDIESLVQVDPLGWAPGSGVTASRCASLVNWLREVPHRLVDINGVTQRLGGALGFGADAPSLVVAERLAELARLGETPSRPLAPWFHPAVQSALQESERVLGMLVATVRSRRAALEHVFTPAALELDLAALEQRFRETHTGFGRWSSQARADRKLIKSVSVSGKAKPEVLAHLGEAAEWQRAERVLDQGERDHAERLGPYYRRTDTDFDRLSTALETARQAVRLAGEDIDVSALARQLGAEGDPDPLLTTLGARLLAELARVRVEAEEHLGAFAARVASMSLHQFAEWCVRAAEALTPGLDAMEHVAAVTGRDVAAGDAREVLRAAGKRDSAAATVFESFERDVAELGSAYRGLETVWPDVDQALSWAGALRERTGGPVPPVVTDRLLSPSFAEADVAEGMDRWVAARTVLLGCFSDARAHELREDFAADLDGAVDLLEEMTDRATEDVAEWLEHTRLLEWFDEEGLSNVVGRLVEQTVPADAVLPAVERSVLAAWADATVRSDDRLERYRAADRDALVTEFRDLDRLLVEDRYTAVVEKCAARRPLSNGSRAAQVIAREAQKKTRHKPIRQLLAETATLVQHLKPCFMMSPLSVSQFLPADMRFDVVIFDEASQVLPWDAVNCVYRGNALIVAGDQKQLPPTNFFGSTSDVDEYDEDAESAPDSFESVLDLGKAAGALRSLPLLWHYRSQHESLISYSNHRVYARELHTFPGATFVAPDLGVESFVVKGVYKRGGSRDNPIEADFVVDRLVHHRREHPHLSLGVVTFSAAQEDAVLAAMELRSSVEPVLKDLLNDHDRLNGFFVKSLENVQGDERDIIVFSVGYGPDEFGKFTMNFGPLNRRSGWRRLNVAITRARRRVEVISSFEPAQVVTDEFPMPDPDQNGVPHLKAYLDFAARGISALAVNPGAADEVPDSPFEEDVLEVIRGMGYTVDAQVGSAGYRIDMAVRHPEKQGEYVLGIECDGAMYHSAKAARDRDRLRQQVLEGLGWRIHRIWGLTWVRDRRGQVERLRGAIEQAIRGDGVPKPTARPGPPPELEVQEIDFSAKPDWTVPYPTHTAYGRQPNERSLAGPAMKEARPALRAYFERILRSEAPVHHGRLMECFRTDWNVGRVGSVIQQNVDLVLSKITIGGQAVRRDRGGFYFLPGGDAVRVRVPTGEDGVRKIGWIPPAELDLAIVLLVRDARAMDSEALGTAVCRLFGWRRNGSDIQAAVSGAVSRLLKTGRLREAGGELLPRADDATPLEPESAQGEVKNEQSYPAPTRKASPAGLTPTFSATSGTAVSVPGSDNRLKGLEEALDRRIRGDLAAAEKACGYHPSYFISTINRLGTLAAVKHMLRADEAHYNHRRLAKHGLLDKAPEAAVLDRRFKDLFTDEERLKAKARLRKFRGH